MPVGSRELTVATGAVSLAGTLWTPADARPIATILMHPGSGPADRHNDVLFPPIREHLLRSGVAVCSFDKRGVGRSTGHWQDAAIAEQADDLLACVALLVEEADGTPVGVFGHSQGGWVVVEAAGRVSPISFTIANSGPGVSPAEQERYATRTALQRSGASAETIEVTMRGYDAVLAAMRDGVAFDRVSGRIEGEVGVAYEEMALSFVPADAAEWRFATALMDYDPRPALERTGAPLLALFGQEDTLVPVDESVAVYREAVRPNLLTVDVFPGADHRLQTGDPPHFAPGYLDTLLAFTMAVAAPRQPAET